jgi:ADP-heptose:LPS heptosyltransferase
MHIDRMRQIDYWIGMPLTWIASTIYRIKKRLTVPVPLPDAAAAKKVLFIELSEMGSTVLADSALRRAGDLYPEAELYFLIFAKNRASLDIMGTIPRERHLVIRNDGLFQLLWDTVAVLWRINQLKIDIVIDFEMFSRFTSLLSLFSGAPIRVGFDRFYGEGLYRGRYLTHRVLYNPYQHIAKTFLSLVHAPLEDPANVPLTKRAFTDAEIALIPQTVEGEALADMRHRLLTAFPQLADYPRWLLLNPNASELMPLRRWPADQYAELATNLLADYPDAALLITGAPGERLEAEALANRLNQNAAESAPNRVISIAGFTKLAELPALYTLASLMVTNDSGPSHFAAPFHLPSVVLYGPETKALYGALNPNAILLFKGLACSPCVSPSNQRKSPCQDNQCMKQITVAEVLQAVHTLLPIDKSSEKPKAPPKIKGKAS